MYNNYMITIIIILENFRTISFSFYYFKLLL